MRRSLCCALILYYCSLLSGAQDGTWSINPAHIPGLTCDSLGFHYTVYPKADGPMSVRLSALDQRGGAHVLSRRRDCGAWIDRLLSGSVSLHAFYNGCYVYEKNHKSMMTIMVEHEYNPGNWTLPQRKVLRCPTLGGPNGTSHLVLVWRIHGKSITDRSPEVCAVPNIDRIACAGPSVSREICNNQGCCFDDGAKTNPCYYGNKVTIQCTQDGRVSVAISKAFTRPPLRLDTVHPVMGEEACRPIQRTNGLILFQFNLSTCGTTSKEIAGIMIYETIMVADIDVKKPNDASIRLHIQCNSESSDRPTKNTESPILSPSSDEKRILDEAASNKTILVSNQRPLYIPTTEKTEASGKGSSTSAGPLGKEWARILLVVCVLAALLIVIYVIKRRPKTRNVERFV